MEFRKLTSPPAGPLIALSDAKAQLRVDHTDDDTVIAGLVDAAAGYLDAEHGILGRALLTQTWTLTLPRFGETIDLPLPPVQSVTEVTYFDTDGVQQTVPVQDYRLVAGPDSAVVELTDGASWPSAASRSDAVSVAFVTGYGTATEIPAPIRQAAMLLVGTWYEHREAATMKSFGEMPVGPRMLLAPFRVPEAMF